VLQLRAPAPTGRERKRSTNQMPRPLITPPNSLRLRPTDRLQPFSMVRQTASGAWEAQVEWEGRPLPLGEQATQQEAEATSDVAKLLVRRARGVQGRQEGPLAVGGSCRRAGSGCYEQRPRRLAHGAQP